MDAPVYHLEHVVRSKEEMEDFNGPLDLILHLLSKNKMEIKDIQIALILDQSECGTIMTPTPSATRSVQRSSSVPL